MGDPDQEGGWVEMPVALRSRPQREERICRKLNGLRYRSTKELGPTRVDRKSTSPLAPTYTTEDSIFVVPEMGYSGFERTLDSLSSTDTVKMQVDSACKQPEHPRYQPASGHIA